ncbi:MAG: DUF935 domain-containing protein [Magnetococcales bacterium]|nr:DUF935 domain-containing protein [Magnetococcales bacterium]
MILDYMGLPVSSPAAGELQTDLDQVQWMHRQTMLHPGERVTPERVREIFREAEMGRVLRQVELMLDFEELDAHLHADMAKRRRALLHLPWTIQPPKDATPKEEEATHELQEVVASIADFDNVLLDLADAIGHGFSCCEILWGRMGGQWLPQKIEHRDPRWFQFGLGDGVPSSEIRLRDGSAAGIGLIPFGWMAHLHRAKSGYATRGGLVRVLAAPFIYKYLGVIDFAEYLEIYGLPLRVGKHPAGASTEERLRLLKAVRDMGHNASGIIPETMAIEFHDAARGSGNNPFEAMISWAEKAMSKAILGATLTSQADGKTSTNALGNIHNDVRLDLLMSDARQIAATLTKDLIWPLAALNFVGSDPTRAPKFVFDLDQTEDLDAFAKAVPALAAAGLKIPTGWLRERLRIPAPLAGEEVLQVTTEALSPWERGNPPDKKPGPEKKATPEPESQNEEATGEAEEPEEKASKTTKARARLPKGGCLHCAALAAKGETPAPDLADRYLTQAMKLAEPATAGMMTPVRALLARCRSLEEFRDGLYALHPDMDATGMAKLLARAMIAAQLGGMDEASRE